MLYHSAGELGGAEKEQDRSRRVGYLLLYAQLHRLCIFFTSIAGKACLDAEMVSSVVGHPGSSGGLLWVVALADAPQASVAHQPKRGIAQAQSGVAQPLGSRHGAPYGVAGMRHDPSLLRLAVALAAAQDELPRHSLGPPAAQAWARAQCAARTTLPPRSLSNTSDETRCSRHRLRPHCAGELPCRDR